MPRCRGRPAGDDRQRLGDGLPGEEHQQSREGQHRGGGKLRFLVTNVRIQGYKPNLQAIEPRTDYEPELSKLRWS
jgi:hypothetical protein